MEGFTGGGRTSCDRRYNCEKNAASGRAHAAGAARAGAVPAAGKKSDSLPVFSSARPLLLPDYSRDLGLLLVRTLLIERRRRDSQVSLEEYDPASAARYSLPHLYVEHVRVKLAFASVASEGLLSFELRGPFFRGCGHRSLGLRLRLLFPLTMPSNLCDLSFSLDSGALAPASTTWLTRPPNARCEPLWTRHRSAPAGSPLGPLALAQHHRKWVRSTLCRSARTTRGS